MTELLERALKKLQERSEAEQDAIAALILEEIEDEERWDTSFARSPEILEIMAAVAEKEYYAGFAVGKDSPLAQPY